jgi:CheY-like chemotaxis protein
VTRPKLLLADDSVTIRKVVELTFADEGIDVTTVADGEGAMAKFVEIQPDIVLVDVGLPGTDGYRICEMIKGDESTSRIPVLLLVGSFEPFDQDAAERSGADGFLTKPFHSIRDLVNRVHELLGTQQEPPVDEVIDFDTSPSADDGNEDIDDLYERSFAETVPIENFETVPAFGAEDAFPEEIAGAEEPDQPITPAEEPDQPVATEQELAPPASGESVSPAMDASHHSVDEWLDDEMIETISAADPAEVHNAEVEAVKAIGQYEDAPAAAVDVEPIKEFDWSPAALVTAADENEIGAAAGFSPSFIHDEPFIPTAAVRNEHVTDELPDLKTDEIPAESNEKENGLDQRAVEPEQAATTDEAALDRSPVAEPPTELIDLIVSRVMERLSDRAVREVAQEAVPRIAERLMREALEEDRNR